MRDSLNPPAISANMSVLFPDNPGTSLGEARFSNFTQEIPDESPEWIADIFPNNSFIDSEAHTITVLGRGDINTESVILVYLTTFMNVVRCIVSMSISATNPVGELVDKILWISLKFFYMTSELSVLTFALLFGHLDSSTSIRRALIATLLISLAHTGIQSVLELKLIDQSITDGFFDLHSQGGLLFWMLTSAAFALRLQSYAVKKNDYYRIWSTVIRERNVFLHPSSNSGNSLFSYRKQRDEHGSGDLPDSYYPRFSGLTSPSYDDLFDCSPRFGTVPFPDAPLMLSTAETAESTVTTRTGSDEWEARHSGYWDTNVETRHLKGLGADGSLVFDDDPYPRWHR
ncbi:hypothetical protein ANCCEY_04825 [Ancylostoma ceylanicum]|uniref:Uncharacterized protein n=1 Tax=Ancylostoma ceylanicum TaxID=53326 RepID=A0A0D6M893_9BILA|nr:hypothetical protein ANCCEY_04825 [Ancylostoma ceylanicum]